MKRERVQGGISSMHAKKPTNGHSNRHRLTEIDRHTDKHTKKGEGRGIKEINAKLLKDTKLQRNASAHGGFKRKFHFGMLKVFYTFYHHVRGSGKWGGGAAGKQKGVELFKRHSNLLNQKLKEEKIITANRKP